MLRNMVIGKVKYLIGPECGTYHPTISGCRVIVLVVEGVTLIHEPGRKGKCCVGDVAPHACVLGLPCKVNKLDSNRSAAHGQ